MFYTFLWYSLHFLLSENTTDLLIIISEAGNVVFISHWVCVCVAGAVVLLSVVLVLSTLLLQYVNL